ncbi:hypothetical protein ABAC460_22625, partial [Asticcacaulis sp. AC460]|uniref:Calx-beta domain-containing protein n=1 Tax=Asticcacaulis sp. AC460 TaxID=1282360 RepID=UPI0003C3D0C9
MAISLSVDDVVVGEDAAYVDFVIRLNEISATAVTVNWQTYNQTAGYNDYTSLSGSLTFSPGVTQMTVRIPITNDSLDEVNEAFTLELYSPSNNVTLAKNVGTAIIVDNDAPSGTPVISISDFIIDEAAGEASFVIILDRPSSQVVSLTYATQ